jgi:DhnA family fructose-bisphosphate aldolase class Ia
VAAEIATQEVQLSGSAERCTNVEGCPPPLLLAGGARAGEPEQAYRQAQEAIHRGQPAVFGRNIFQADDPAAELIVISIVHGDS